MSKPYTSPAGYHRHKCEKCGCVWEHIDRASMYAENAHDCPACGAANHRFKYDGPAAPEHPTRPPTENAT